MMQTKVTRGPGCGAEARRFLDENVALRLPRAVVEDARLVLSELVNNAYVHGEGQIEVALQVRDGRLRIEVIDEGQGAAIKVRRQGAGGGGHGLRLVQALTGAWGAHEGTTHVWAELDTA